MGELPVAATPQAITAAWCEAVFRKLGHDVSVRSVTSKPIGTGQSAHSERFQVEYARWDGRAPQTFVAKLPHPDPTSRATGHVHGSYARETNFYRQVAPTVRIRTPRCYYADIDPANSDFVLLLEDMAPARQGDQMHGCDVAVAEVAMLEIAGLHAPRWGDLSLLELKFLAGTGTSGSVARALYEPFWQGFLARYRDRLAPELIRVGEGLVRHYDTYARTYPGARCATHGDYRLDNVLIANRNGRVTLAVVDWQTAGVGCGAADVAYFLGAGLLPDERRRRERDLLRVYRDALLEGGVRDYSERELWHDYVWYSYAGYVMAVVASMLVVQTPRGDEMFMTMAERHGQHVLDHDAEALLARG
jgi:hypothetical protein